MLVEINVENVAVIESAALEFEEGMTAITGETGAGKSLMVQAASLCLGDRADATIIRTAAKNAKVNTVFKTNPEILNTLHQLGEETEDGYVYLQRIISTDGKNQCRLNGKLVPLSVIKTLGDELADLHGQHEHQKLLNKESHLSTLDEWIGEKATTIKEKIEALYEQYKQLQESLQVLNKNEAEREQQLDILRFQINEIEAAQIQLNEKQNLESELQILKHAEKLSQTIAFASEQLFIADTNAKSLITASLRNIENVTQYDDSIQTLADRLHNLSLELETCIEDLRTLQNKYQNNPAKLEQIAERIDIINKLFRKYGDSEQAVLDYLQSAKQKLFALENADASQSEIKQKLQITETELNKKCEQISELRKQHAKIFSEKITQELKQLAMENAKFEVSFRNKTPTSNGADEIEFIFSANSGEALKPINKVASGGELSRLMLAIKLVLAGKGGAKTLLFDEVDAGLGGESALKVGQKLKQLSESYQVIVVTHLPQIACFADTQYNVEKLSSKNKTSVRVVKLEKQQRIEEIARMLSGDAQNKAALNNAKQMLSGVT